MAELDRQILTPESLSESATATKAELLEQAKTCRYLSRTAVTELAKDLLLEEATRLEKLAQLRG